jgi:hypothetical protein
VGLKADYPPPRRTATGISRFLIRKARRQLPQANGFESFRRFRCNFPTPIAAAAEEDAADQVNH